VRDLRARAFYGFHGAGRVSVATPEKSLQEVERDALAGEQRRRDAAYRRDRRFGRLPTLRQ